MCGRFSLFAPVDELKQTFQFAFPRTLEPRYNIAPGQDILTVWSDGEQRVGGMMRWGLIPFWAKDEKVGYKMINARAETVNEKASFKRAFEQRRCLILADGFYEWKKENTKKQPYRITMTSNKPFAFAGLWENWNHEDKQITTCTIITTTPNERTKSIHDRMPVILPDEKLSEWLHPSSKLDDLKSLLTPFDAGQMEVQQITSAINSAKNEGEDLIHPLNSL